MKIRLLFSIIFFCILSSEILAITPEKRLPEPLEQRARNLFLQVRCLVCEGQVIESSDAELAREMRGLIRQKIADGASDEEIKAELVKNFGAETVTSSNNLWLWLLPLLLFFSLLFLIVRPKTS